MARARVALAGSAAVVAALAATPDAHAPAVVRTGGVAVAATTPPQPPVPDAARRAPTPWPAPFAQLADRRYDFAAQPPRRGSFRPGTAMPTDTRPPSPVPPLLARQTPVFPPVPPQAEPAVVADAVRFELASPVTAPPLARADLSAPQPLQVAAPFLSALPPAFDGTNPLSLLPPVFTAPVVATPAANLVSVPEPTAASVVLAAPLLLLGRRRRRACRGHV